MFLVCHLSSSHPRLSSVSVVFDFSASFNDAAPVSPIPLSVYVKRKGKSELLMDVFASSFIITPQKEISECCV